MRKVAVRLLAVALLPIVSFYILSLMAARPTNLGASNGRLTPCPGSPNCVCTQADDAGHRIAPLEFRGPSAAAMQRLKAVIATQPRMKIVSETDTYLHVEATTRIFRFVDDVEFLIDEAGGVIHFRSASRVGYGDLGTNRIRMERIRAAWDRADTDG